jgi:hypothetical protein
MSPAANSQIQTPTFTEYFEVPEVLKEALQPLSKKQEDALKRLYPPKPPDFEGSEAEWAVNWALIRRGADFQFQQSFWYGRLQVGGSVADFSVYAPVRVIIRVQGVHWHYGLGSTKIEDDRLGKAKYMADGFSVVDIDENDALENPLYYVDEAFRGNDHSKTARGG